MKKSDEFEQRIHSIHELLEGAEAQVTWNDHLPDPDNPAQPRQIDVTIKRGRHLTLIECRIHKSRQGVKWVEELMGRRTSLHADSVIGVSSSGFTKGALLKAATYEIALRDLHSLTEPEIAKWGQSISLTLLCYQYSDLTLSLTFEGDEHFDLAAAREQLRAHPVWVTLFNQAANHLTSNGMITDARINDRVAFGIRGEPEGVTLGGRRVREMEFTGRAHVVVQQVKCPVVEAYGAPREGASAVIERFDLGETSVVHDDDRVAIIVDIAKVNLPPLCQFRFVKTNGTCDLEIERFELRGFEKLAVSKGKVDVVLKGSVDIGPAAP